MINNLSTTLRQSITTRLCLDNHLPFAEYIAQCRALITKKRTTTSQLDSHLEKIIDANAPFELYPNKPIFANQKLKYGVLLIHGLLDCPFSLRDIGTSLQANGILSRAILLPGHGTTPGDLLHVSFHDWIETVRYGIEALRQEVEHVFLIGYSTGATLSLHQALKKNHISGLVLLSPAIKIKAPVNIVVGWHYLIKWLTRDHLEWLYKEDEIDYAKYQSIVFNSITQVAKLTRLIQDFKQQHSLSMPMLMVISREDETISSHRAINFFSQTHHPDSKLLLYTGYDHRYPDTRIQPRRTHYPNLCINHFSHMSIPFAPANPHYGEHGDFMHASHTNTQQFVYGAYNHIETQCFDILHQLGLLKQSRRELTYNPDFDFMAQQIVEFVLGTK